MLKRSLFVFFALFMTLGMVFSIVGCAEEGASGPQVLRVNLAGDPDTIDPNKASWADQITVAGLCFEGLLGFTKELTLTPAVAKEIPTTANGGISADGKTYTFKLRSDMTWSDGEKVKAQDFEFAIKRMLSPEYEASVNFSKLNKTVSMLISRFARSVNRRNNELLPICLGAWIEIVIA